MNFLIPFSHCITPLTSCHVNCFLTNEVAEGGEEEPSNADEEEEQAELLVAVPQGEQHGLETRGVAGQLQDAGQLENTEHLGKIIVVTIGYCFSEL